MSPQKDLSPRYTRRAFWHDYRSRSLYMITITKRAGVPAFSHIGGTVYQPTVSHSAVGKIIREELSALENRYEEVSIYGAVIMPDHIHFVIHISRQTDYHLGKIIGEFKGACSRQYWQQGGKAAESVFADRFHDRIIKKPGQLNVVKRYIIDNPRRLMIKRTFPDLFSRRLQLTLNGEKFDALGNIFLLRNPQIEQVRVSRKFTQEQIAAFDLQWRLAIEDGGVLVSPFISPREKVYRDMAIENGGNVIIIEENGMGERFKPTGRYFDLCAEGRLLIIAPQNHNLSKITMSRQMAMHLNDLAACIAAGEFTVSFSHHH